MLPEAYRRRYRAKLEAEYKRISTPAQLLESDLMFQILQTIEPATPSGKNPEAPHFQDVADASTIPLPCLDACRHPRQMISLALNDPSDGRVPAFS